MLDRETAEEWHRYLFGTSATDDQVRLYAAGGARGYSSKRLCQDRAAAIVVYALLLGAVDDRVVFLVPGAHESWVLDQIRVAFVRCLERAKRGRDRDRARERVAGFTKLFHRFWLTGRVLQLTEEPAHWVSLGFSAAEDLLPAWMPNRLLEDSAIREGAVAP